MAIFKNGGNLTTGFNVSALAPIDGRFVADYLTDLIDSAAWSNSNASQYAGLVTYVKETGKLYILHSTSGSLITITDKTTEEEKQAALSNWSPVVDQSDLSKLSGVFKFKGVAEAISEDLRILTCGEAYILEQGKSVQLSCQATAYDLGLEMYYAWASSDANIRFWTDTDTLAKDTILYGKANDMQVYYIEDEQGERYYLNTNSVSPTGGDDIAGVDPSKCLGFLNKDASDSGDYENAIYIHCEGGPGVLTNGGTYPIVNMGTYSYTGQSATVHIVDTCVFYELSDSAKYPLYADAKGGVDLSVVDRPVKSITAASDNRGDVYLIKENEYASNGQIWVKLGSPVEDWVIL